MIESCCLFQNSSIILQIDSEMDNCGCCSGKVQNKRRKRNVKKLSNGKVKVQRRRQKIPKEVEGDLTEVYVLNSNTESTMCENPTLEDCARNLSLARANSLIEDVRLIKCAIDTFRTMKQLQACNSEYNKKCK